MQSKLLIEYWNSKLSCYNQLGEPTKRDASWLMDHLYGRADRLEHDADIIMSSVGAIPRKTENYHKEMLVDFERSRIRAEYLYKQAEVYRIRAELYRRSVECDGYALKDKVCECKMKIEYLSKIQQDIKPVEIFSIAIPISAVQIVKSAIEDGSIVDNIDRIVAEIVKKGAMGDA